MSIIYMNLNGFLNKYPIFKVDENGQTELIGQSELQALPVLLPEICFANNCNKVMIEGLGPFAQHFKEIITQNYAQQTYPIEIEVI